MISIEIDNNMFEVYADKTLWSPSSANGAFVSAPEAYALLARALVCCDYEDREGHSYVAGILMLEEIVDTHGLNSEGKMVKVPGGRRTGIHPPLKAGLPTWARAKRVLTGVFEGKKVVSVLQWDDPLDQVVTAREVSQRFGIDESTVKKAQREGRIAGRRSGATWLFRLADVQRMWG